MINRPYLNAPGRASVYEHSLTITAPPAEEPLASHKATKRGRVTTFSRRSRTRLIRTFSRLQTSRVSSPLFVTLTYHHAHEAEGHNPAEDLNTFLVALRRDHPTVQYMWRLEFQARGAPHFHLLLFARSPVKSLKSDSFERWLATSWHRIADPNSVHHAARGVHVREADSYRKAYSYLSKYTAKISSADGRQYKGRRWSRSRSLPVHPIKEYELTDQQYYCLRRILRKLVRSRSKQPSRYEKHLRSCCTASVSLEHEDVERILGLASGTPPRLTPGFPTRKGVTIRPLRALGEAIARHRADPFDPRLPIAYSLALRPNIYGPTGTVVAGGS